MTLLEILTMEARPTTHWIPGGGYLSQKEVEEVEFKERGYLSREDYLVGWRSLQEAFPGLGKVQFTNLRTKIARKIKTGSPTYRIVIDDMCLYSKEAPLYSVRHHAESNTVHVILQSKLKIAKE